MNRQLSDRALARAIDTATTRFNLVAHIIGKMRPLDFEEHLLREWEGMLAEAEDELFAHLAEAERRRIP